MTVLLSPFRWKFFFPIRFRWLQLLKADQFHPLNSEYCIPKSSIWLQGHKSMFLFYDAFFFPPSPEMWSIAPQGVTRWPLTVGEWRLPPASYTGWPLIANWYSLLFLDCLIFFVIKALLFFFRNVICGAEKCVHPSVNILQRLSSLGSQLSEKQSTPSSHSLSRVLR